ncbi:magnesium transporter NIPA-domain-containing protein [Crassisporium funariophilum]|nr:magnesium transporter NIPA-domain-containing protein [Crassisporium funariophilum]
MSIPTNRLLDAAAQLSASLVKGIDDLPKMTTQTFVGIMVAVTGNILISLALNLQKLAHKRVEKLKKAKNQGANRYGSTPPDHRVSDGPSLNEYDEDQELHHAGGEPDIFSDSPIAQNPSESQPLVAFPDSEPLARDYGTEPSTITPGRQSPKVKRSLASRLVPFRSKKSRSGKKFLLPVDIMSEEAALHGLPTKPRTQRAQGDDDESEQGNESDYLKTKLWWSGFLLMNVGELGNFISYAFAPASVVAPLGTFALMANCFFAPVLLGEYFRKRDLIGVAIAAIGAVTVVLASNASDTRLDPDALLRAISQTSFIIYSCVYVVGVIILATLSEGRIGKNWVFVDVGLCALFGGFTVLSTKALSTLLTLEWIDMFTKWITYPLIGVLASTGVGQIRYLNRALMRFDSKVVIPIQFVLFTLSAIIGSAILYGDFQKAKFHQIVTFLYGCAATFAGVFIIAWTPKPEDERMEDVGEGDDATSSVEPVPGTPDGPRLGLGTIGRRRRATLILPSGVSGPRDTPTLRHKRSGIGLMGISPAQHLLLVHTPPREIPMFGRRDGDLDIERHTQTPDSYRRRRTTSWYGYDGRGDRSKSGTRESSIVGRLRNGAGRVGSLDGQTNTP